MLRIVVDAIPIDVGAWSIELKLADPDGTQNRIRDPYRMESVAVGARRVPRPPADRAAEITGSHAVLCSGGVQALEQLLERLGQKAPDQGDSALYGSWLFECLLAPGWSAIKKAVMLSLAATDPPGSMKPSLELALCWPADSADLNGLAWEAMRVDNTALVADLEHVTAITRLVPNSASAPGVISSIPRVLFVTGSPLADPIIRPGAMFMGLLQSLDNSGWCRSKTVLNATIEDLRAACESFAPHIVHLVAHGELSDDGHGLLMLRAGNGSAGQLEAGASALMAALTASGVPHLVVLSACHSGADGLALDDPANASPLAAELVAAGIPIVSAMVGEVGERACRLYTRQLTKALHEGRSIVEASAHGRRSALMDTTEMSNELDWALPTLYLAESIDPNAPIIDRALGDRIARLADSLKFRREPIFIGRQAILAAADELVDPHSRVGVVAALSTSSGQGLGGSRLLQEISWRLLRDGHLPLLIGPFSSPANAPASILALAVGIVGRALRMLELLDMPPFVPELLWLGAAQTEIAGLEALLAPGIPVSRAYTGIRTALTGLSTSLAGTALSADQVRAPLSADLKTLAVRARSSGQPFGDRTTVVVLCDNVHWWGVPTPGRDGDQVNGLDGLLSMVEASGLGSSTHRVPVVLSGSESANAGAALSRWKGDGFPWIKSLKLGELSDQEALLGHQWVLLHPWESQRPDGPYGPLYRKTYTASPGREVDWEKMLAKVDRRPSAIAPDLYIVASVGVSVEVGREDDDEGAWRSYAEAQGVQG